MVCKKKNPSWMFGADRKFCPSESLFGITRLRLVMPNNDPFGADFSIHTSHFSFPELVTRVYPKKQKQVILHVLPLLWHLLGATNSSGAVQGGSSSIRSATGKLVNALYAHMGNSLIDRASSDPNVTPRHIQLLQDLIDH